MRGVCGAMAEMVMPMCELNQRNDKALRTISRTGIQEKSKVRDLLALTRLLYPDREREER